MVKKKLTLNKSELVEIIASTVSTIQEQEKTKTVGDVAATMGNFGAFFNWSWEKTTAFGDIKDTKNLSRTSMVFTSKEYSMWDTGEEYYAFELRLKPAEYRNEIAKIFPNEKLNMKVKSMPPTNAIGTNKITVTQENAKQYVGDAAYYNQYTVMKDAGTTNTTIVRQSWDPEKEITISWYININPAFWYAQSEDGKGTYNWPINATSRGDKPDPKEAIEEQGYLTRSSTNKKIVKEAKVNTTNYAGQILYDWTTDIEFQMGSVTGTARVRLEIDIRMGIMAFIVLEEFRKETPFAADGTKPYAKHPWANPMNWSFNSKLDLLAFVFFLIAGAFTDGVGWIAAARMLTWGAYATVVGINLIDYLKKGDFKMAGIHMLMEALMFAKPLKWFKGGTAAFMKVKGVKWFTAKIASGIKYVGIGSKFTTVKSAQSVLVALKNNPAARRMIRIIASGGEEALKKLKGGLKRAGSYKQATVEMAEEFIAAVVKANPKLAGKITIIQARKILVQGSNRTKNRLLQSFASVPEVIISAVVLISLYDLNMIWYPFQVFLLGVKPEDATIIEFTPGYNLQVYTHEMIAKKFGWWRVKDLISSTRMPDSPMNYVWEPVRASYVAAISGPRVKAGNCATIPKERYKLYTDNEFTPTEDERTKYKAKQIAGNAGDYQGVRIEAKKLIGREDVNIALKEDWLIGWRPEQECESIDLNDIKTLMKQETEDNLQLDLPAPEGDPSKNTTDWSTYIAPGAKKYYEMNGNVYLELEVGGRGGESYVMAERPVAKTLIWFNTLPAETKQCVKELFLSLTKYDPLQEDNDSFSAWVPPVGCTKLGIDWSEWLYETNLK